MKKNELFIQFEVIKFKWRMGNKIRQIYSKLKLSVERATEVLNLRMVELMMYVMRVRNKRQKRSKREHKTWLEESGEKNHS